MRHTGAASAVVGAAARTFVVAVAGTFCSLTGEYKVIESSPNSSLSSSGCESNDSLRKAVLVLPPRVNTGADVRGTGAGGRAAW